MSDNFYVTLVSNSESRYEDNTTSSFRTDLINEIQTSSDYYVALTEFIYLHSWKIRAGTLEYTLNSEKQEIKIEVFDGETIEDLLSRLNTTIKDLVLKKIYRSRHLQFEEIVKLSNPQEKLKSVEGILPSDYYNDSPDIRVIYDITRNDVEYTDAPKFLLFEKNIYISITNKAVIKIEGLISEVINCRKNVLFQINSIGKLEKINQEVLFSKEKPIQLTQKLYIYSDLIEYQYIANLKSPLLRTIVIDYHTDYKIKTSHFNSSYYLKVNKTNFSSILIEIKDEKGNPILFEKSSVELKLHFKRIYNR